MVVVVVVCDVLECSTPEARAKVQMLSKRLLLHEVPKGWRIEVSNQGARVRCLCPTHALAAQARQATRANVMREVTCKRCGSTYPREGICPQCAAIIRRLAEATSTLLPSEE